MLRFLSVKTQVYIHLMNLYSWFLSQFFFLMKLLSDFLSTTSNNTSNLTTILSLSQVLIVSALGDFVNTNILRNLFISCLPQITSVYFYTTTNFVKTKHYQFLKPKFKCSDARFHGNSTGKKEGLKISIFKV